MCVYMCATLLLWSAIGCLMLARISSFRLSIVEAVTHSEITKDELTDIKYYMVASVHGIG